MALADVAKNVVKFAQSDSSNDWRKDSEPEDTLFAIDSYYSKDDFSGRAAIYEDSTATKPLAIDLFIQSVDLNMDERIQVTDHVADTFGITCFGKAPLLAVFTGTLADTNVTFGKQYLVDAYKNKLRLGAVSRTGKVPVIRFGRTELTGPFLALKITTDSKSEDTIVIVLTMFVTSYQIVKPSELTDTKVSGDTTIFTNRTNKGDVVLFDYIHGVETEHTSVAGKTLVNISTKKTVSDAASNITSAVNATNTSNTSNIAASVSAAAGTINNPPGYRGV